MAGCEDATQRAIKAWSATLSCHVVSATPFVLINCWAKCVTSCQADCWCPSGHPSVPAARWRYCGSGGGRQRRARACRMWDNTGKEEEGIPELFTPAQPSVSESTPLPLLPHPPPGIDSVILSPLCVRGMWVKIAFFAPCYSLLVSLLNSRFSDGLTRWDLYDLTEAVTCLLCRH